MKKAVFMIIGLFLICPLALNAQNKKMGDGGKDIDRDNEFGIPMDDLDLTMDDINDIFSDSDDADSMMPDNFLKEWANYRNDSKYQKEFENAFKNKFQKYNEYISNLDNYSTYSKCFYLMAKYIIELEELKVATEEASECRRTYDLYGMQLMAMMSSTTIMFCTEELYNKIADMFGTLEVGERRDPHEFDELVDFTEEMEALLKHLDFLSNTNEADFQAVNNYTKNWTDFERTLVLFFGNVYKPTVQKGDKTYFDVTKVASLIEKYFHPLSLIKEGVTISQQMDRLKPCTGY